MKPVIRTLLSATILSFSTLNAVANEPEKSFTPAQIETDVTLALNAFRDIHPGYDRFTPSAEIDAAFQSMIEEVNAKGALSFSDFYLDMSETLAKIRCDHTKAELPRAMSKARVDQAVYLPLGWEIVEGRAIVTKTPEGSSANIGDEILSIDGRTIETLQEALYRYIPVDGYNDHSKDALMTASLEHAGGAVDHFGAFLFNPQPRAELAVQTPEGVMKTISVDRVGFDTWKSIAVEPAGRNFKDAVSVERIGERGAYLKIDSFVNYRSPVEPDDMYDPVFKMLKAEGRDQLILDLRENGGGSTDASQGLFARFTPTNRKMKRAALFKTLDHSAYEDYITTWEKRAINPSSLGFKKTKAGEYSLRPIFTEDLKTVRPSKFGYEGELVVLTSRSNSSGATNFISAAAAVRPVTLIGEKTGGNPLGPTAGTIFFLKLPESKMVLRLPVIRYENNVGDLPKGEGLTPDLLAPTTVASIRTNSDPALDAALAFLKEKDAGTQ